jgi:hypothetical protein
MKTSIPKLRVLCGLVVGGLMVAGGSALADDIESYRVPRSTQAHSAADGALVDVQIKVDGATAPLFFRPGTWDKHYFQASQGRNYSIVLHNNTDRRIGVLVAVDGLNVVNGERSSMSRNESMYVLDPRETTEIRGWRTSLRDIRRFLFVDEERSYAERTGQANGDMGWIRVLAFQEQSRWGLNRGPKYRDELEKAPQSTPSPRGQNAPEASDNRRETAQRMDGAAPESNPGTGWGDQRVDPVRRVEFMAERNATDRITLRYEYASGLRALGIVTGRRTRVWEREQGQVGFAKPPRW